ncbi:DUF3551 domain-containing protein [Bradyrhizobium liaoningense]|uniref:DUF3551 domain-containing protein n=1 Tax=Bradyrhizobium liaoningense TaxID=43992 RepID=UPI001BABDB64|nr:DUF3551 domain-containing protein [Bradyrhizobium liaoningense]MBR0717483.1 DUF3551 domain-containing protein [Bradyrhizobium liaoningense]
MRCSISTVVCGGAVLAAIIHASPSLARSRSVQARPVAQDRFCLQGRIWGWPGNCLFATYSQCVASASGTDAFCALNPTYAFREWKGSNTPTH